MTEDRGTPAAAGSGGLAAGPGAQRRIVVGVDGSEPSKAALAWAVRQGEQTGARVEAVFAWDFPAVFGVVSAGVFDFVGLAAHVLADTITEVGNPARVHPRVLRGHAAQVLIDASAGADLLVVGSRGHGGFAGVLLGSVSQHCVHHAPCPVVVIRGTQAAAGGRRQP